MHKQNGMKLDKAEQTRMVNLFGKKTICTKYSI